jgi:hypothetical protein
MIRMKPVTLLALASLLLLLPTASAGNSWLIQASTGHGSPDASACDGAPGVQAGGAQGCVASGPDGTSWLIVTEGNTWLLQASTQCASPGSGCTYTVLGLGLL